MVEVCVAGDHEVEPRHAERAECWQYDALARVEALEVRSGVDQHGGVVALHERGIPLPHVEERGASGATV